MVIVFTALLLVILMIFAALALDLGGLYNARRNDQNAADTSALGGAQSLGDTNANLISEVKSLAESTLGATLTAADWNSCGAITDPDSIDTVLSGANCITTNGARTQLQVRIPTRQLNATFGRVAGINSFDHDAFAIAGLVSTGFGSVLPFGMPSSAGGGDGYACIKSGSGGTSVEPCGGASSGNFGYVDFGQFGNTDVGTSLSCGNGGQRPRSANNMAVGVDHDLSVFGGPPHNGTSVVDTISCGSTPQLPKPNSMDTTTGNTVSQSLNPGIAFGTGFSDGGPGRLARTNPLLFAGSGTTRSVSGTQLDDNPLWEFIPASFPTGTSVPTSCVKSVFTDVYAGTLSNLPASVSALLTPKQRPERMRLLLQRCFTHYNGQDWNAGGAIAGIGDPTSCPSSGCTAAVFSRNSSSADQPDLYDIQYTSRFGYVPQLTTDFPNGNQTVYIGRFRAIFFQRLLGSCNGNSCGLDFEPGLGINKSGSPQDAEAITAFVFPATMLPNGLASTDAPFNVGKNRFVRLIR
ncbi:MAG: pilus assembly protein TadG-related protein [Acidimicrobiales bacterium]